MSDKLEALSQPVAYAVFADNGNIRIWSTNKNITEDVGVSVPLYVQEYVTELLAALEEKDREIDKLKSQRETLKDSVRNWMSEAFTSGERAEAAEQRLELVREQRDNELRTNAELEQRLQQTIKLPDYDTNDYGYKSLSNDEVVAALKEQGFKVEGE